MVIRLSFRTVPALEAALALSLLLAASPVRSSQLQGCDEPYPPPECRELQQGLDQINQHFENDLTQRREEGVASDDLDMDENENEWQDSNEGSGVVQPGYQ
jgi:hypothetical protein